VEDDSSFTMKSFLGLIDTLSINPILEMVRKLTCPVWSEGARAEITGPTCLNNPLWIEIDS
jgi:hypothetical protein